MKKRKKVSVQRFYVHRAGDSNDEPRSFPPQDRVIIAIQAMAMPSGGPYPNCPALVALAAASGALVSLADLSCHPCGAYQT